MNPNNVPDWLLRVIAEELALTTKIKALHSYIMDPQNKDVDPLLIIQFDCMKAYATVLRMRIKVFQDAEDAK